MKKTIFQVKYIKEIQTKIYNKYKPKNTNKTKTNKTKTNKTNQN